MVQQEKLILFPINQKYQSSEKNNLTKADFNAY